MNKKQNESVSMQNKFAYHHSSQQKTCQELELENTQLRQELTDLKDENTKLKAAVELLKNDLEIMGGGAFDSAEKYRQLYANTLLEVEQLNQRFDELQKITGDWVWFHADNTQAIAKEYAQVAADVDATFEMTSIPLLPALLITVFGDIEADVIKSYVENLVDGVNKAQETFDFSGVLNTTWLAGVIAGGYHFFTKTFDLTQDIADDPSLLAGQILRDLKTRKTTSLDLIASLPDEITDRFEVKNPQGILEHLELYFNVSVSGLSQKQYATRYGINPRQIYRGKRITEILEQLAKPPYFPDDATLDE